MSRSTAKAEAPAGGHVFEYKAHQMHKIHARSGNCATGSNQNGVSSVLYSNADETGKSIPLENQIMDGNLTLLVLELTKIIAFGFWVVLTLRGIWEGFRLAVEFFTSHRQLRRIGEHRAYRD
jgi:hypothetical protein